MPRPIIKGYTPEWGSVVGGVRTSQFTTVGTSDEIISQLLYVSISGTFTGVVYLERFVGGTWTVVDTFSSPETVTFENPKALRMRLHCVSLSGGVVSYAIEDVYVAPTAEKGEPGPPGNPGPPGSGGGGGGSADIARFNSIADLQATSIPAEVKDIIIEGAISPGDAGPSMRCKRAFTGLAPTWNTLDKDAGVALSNNNLTATYVSGTDQEVRSGSFRVPVGGSSYYFEVTATGSGSALGLSNVYHTLPTSWSGADTNSFGWFGNGFVYLGGAQIGTAAAYTTGDVLGIELLATSAKLYKNGTLVFTVSSLPAEKLCPIVNLTSSGNAFTLNCGPTFAHRPSGALDWAGSAILPNGFTRSADRYAPNGSVDALDGGYWQYQNRNEPVWLEWFGGKGDLYITSQVDGTASINSSPTDNKSAFENASKFIYVASRGNCAMGPTLQLGYGGYYISDTPDFDRGHTIQGMGSGYQNTSTRIVVAPGKKGLFLRQMQGGLGSQTTIRDLEVRSLGAAGQTDKHGIDMKTTCIVENCTITGFGGNGINIDSDVNLGTGANCSRVKGCFIGDNKGDGIYFHGGDSNACHTDSCSFIANLGWAINDRSFLANAHHGHHASTNGNYQLLTGGPYYAEGINGPTTFVGCYSEGDQAPSYAGNLTVFIGGLHGAFVYCDGGVWQMGRQWKGGMQLEPRASYDATDNCFFRLRDGGPNTLMQFGSGRGSLENSPIDFRYIPNTAFLYQYANQDGNYSFGLSPNEGSFIRNPWVGPNNVMMPKGFFYGTGGFLSDQRFFTCSRLGSGPPAGVNVKYEMGDVCIDDTAGSIGWICSTGGITTDTTWVSGTTYFLGKILRTPAGRVYRLAREPYDPDAWTMPKSTVMPTHTTPNQVLAYPEPNPHIDPGEGATIPGYSWECSSTQSFTDFIWQSGSFYTANVSYVFVRGPNLYYNCRAVPTQPTPIFNQTWVRPGSTIEPTHTSGTVEYPEPNPSPSGSEPSTIPGYIWEYISSNPAAVWSRVGARFYRGSVTHDAASLAAGAVSADITIPVSGAAMGDFPTISCSIDTPGMAIVNQRVSATDTVKFRLWNVTTGAVDLPNATFYATIER